MMVEYTVKPDYYEQTFKSNQQILKQLCNIKGRLYYCNHILSKSAISDIFSILQTFAKKCQNENII